MVWNNNCGLLPESIKARLEAKVVEMASGLTVILSGEAISGNICNIVNLFIDNAQSGVSNTVYLYDIDASGGSTEIRRVSVTDRETISPGIQLGGNNVKDVFWQLRSDGRLLGRAETSGYATVQPLYWNENPARQ